MKGLPNGFIHGMTDTPEHATWTRMINRCECLGDTRFIRYGGRGIKVCRRWRKSFLAFFKDMGKRPSPDHSIDRIDNDGDYTPKNCQWATRKQQLRNYSLNRLLTAFGETKSAIEWSEDRRCRVAYKTLHARATRTSGWTHEEMITKPIYGVRHEHGRKPRRKSA